MRSLLARLFKILFLVKPIRYYYFAFHKRIFQPFGLFKGVSKNIIYRTSFKIRVELNDWIPQQLYFLGTYEEKEILFISKTLTAGEVFIDVGANIGIFTLVASKLVGDSGKVYSFEPLSGNFNKLSFHIAENCLGNVVAERLAVSNEDEMLTLFVDDRWNKEEVNGVSLDNYFATIDLKRLALIKIDIEGGELPALAGMENLIRTHHPIILIEINPEVLRHTPYS
jgi:FkbM family methyltransferase